VPLASSRSTVYAAIGALAAAGGGLAAIHYHGLGLTLSHYDARGHVVVARRIFDSITPGWQQIGAVWLPLPHLLNALPVQIDTFYQTGASGVAISVVSFAVAVAAVAAIVLGATGSTLAAAGGATLLALNPNVLYLQATPMTEPLLLGLMTLSVALLMNWTESDLSPELKLGPTIGLAFALACLTRYEAWPVTVSALVIWAWARWRAGTPWPIALRSVMGAAAYPLLAILGFLVFSRVVIGEWFVASGFFVPENTALNHPIEAFSQILWGIRTLSGDTFTVVAVAGFIWLVIHALVTRRGATAAVTLSLYAAAALPWWAFLHGHPYRIRYMVPLIAAEAIAAGILMGALMKRTRALGTLAIAGLVVAVAVERPPLDPGAAMVVEAQWDRPNVAARRQVTECLSARYHGETIMASMGSLGHYMQEMSAAGFAVRDFLHEGNGDIWLAALEGPRPFVGWILVEEKAEGGDMLANIGRENPHFFDGFSRVCAGSGVALYERQNRMLKVAR